MSKLFEKLGIEWKLQQLIENSHSRKNYMLYVEEICMWCFKTLNFLTRKDWKPEYIEIHHCKWIAIKQLLVYYPSIIVCKTRAPNKTKKIKT